MLPIWQRLQKVDQVPGLWSVRQLAGPAGLAARRVGVAHANATAAASVAPQVAAAGVPALAAPKEVAPQVAGAGAGVGVPAPAAHQVAPTALRVPASKKKAPKKNTLKKGSPRKSLPQLLLLPWPLLLLLTQQPHLCSHQ